ncbi:hypothetical protein KPH14_006239 [Odynerus spinipes]|uniref:Ku domain-containing protein n=1 Tax=Odynerus spinipes TaxID=1348599 RepID=A0AAD9VN53_9HYME|nr:hypothetical protein KPH14_006239 [Odynerus spinipes]
MATKKESLVFIIDVGISSKDSQNNPFPLDKAKRITQRIIEKKIFLRPKDEIGIILMGSNTTCNKLQFKNIKAGNMEVPKWKLIKFILKQQHTTCLSNWIEALYVAIDYIEHECINNSIRTIVLFSDFKAAPNIKQSDINNIVHMLQEQRIQLLAIGTESLLEKSKSSITFSEKVFLDICKQVNGKYRTIDKALDDVCFITKAQSKPMAMSFTLEIFDLQIPVKSYVKVKMENKFPPWKFATDVNSQSETIQPKYPVKVVRVKELLDRHREIHKSETTVHGYMYGGVFVVFADEDEKAMLYKSGPKSYKFMHTAKKDDIGIQYWCTSSSTRIILPANQNVAPQFYSLLQAMNDENVVAIFRKVSKKDSVPNIVALFPRINTSDEPWCFVEIKLPFAEDTRVMDSKPLTSFVKQLSTQQNEIIDYFLDSFMSSEINDASEEKKKEEFMPGCIPNSMKQHTYNMLSYRALNPEKPLPPIDTEIKELLNPCKLIIEKLEAPVQEIKSLFDFDDNATSEITTSKHPEDVAIKGQSLDVPKNHNSSIDNESSEELDLPVDTLDIDMDQLMANM